MSVSSQGMSVSSQGDVVILGIRGVREVCAVISISNYKYIGYNSISCLAYRVTACRFIHSAVLLGLCCINGFFRFVESLEHTKHRNILHVVMIRTQINIGLWHRYAQA